MSTLLAYLLEVEVLLEQFAESVLLLFSSDVLRTGLVVVLLFLLFYALSELFLSSLSFPRSKILSLSLAGIVLLALFTTGDLISQVSRLLTTISLFVRIVLFALCTYLCYLLYSKEYIPFFIFPLGICAFFLSFLGQESVVVSFFCVLGCLVWLCATFISKKSQKVHVDPSVYMYRSPLGTKQRRSWASVGDDIDTDKLKVLDTTLKKAMSEISAEGKMLEDTVESESSWIDAQTKKELRGGLTLLDKYFARLRQDIRKVWEDVGQHRLRVSKTKEITEKHRAGMATQADFDELMAMNDKVNNALHYDTDHLSLAYDALASQTQKFIRYVRRHNLHNDKKLTRIESQMRRLYDKILQPLGDAYFKSSND